MLHRYHISVPKHNQDHYNNHNNNYYYYNYSDHKISIITRRLLTLPCVVYLYLTSLIDGAKFLVSFVGYSSVRGVQGRARGLQAFCYLARWAVSAGAWRTGHLGFLLGQSYDTLHILFHVQELRRKS